MGFKVKGKRAGGRVETLCSMINSMIMSQSSLKKKQEKKNKKKRRIKIFNVAIIVLIISIPFPNCFIISMISFFNH